MPEGEPDRTAITQVPVPEHRQRRPRSPYAVGLLGGLGFLTAVVLLLAVRQAASVLLIMVAALFLAVGLDPAVRWLQRRGLGRGLAAMMVVFGGLLLLCGGLFALVPPLVSQSGEFVGRLPEFLDRINSDPRVARLDQEFDLISRAKEVVTPQNLTKALGGALGGVQLFIGAVFTFLTTLVLTIYFLTGLDRLKRGLFGLFPASRRVQAEEIGEEIFDKIGAYILGSLAIALTAGVVTFVFLLIVGVPYAFVLAVVVAVCDLIPQIGAMLGAIVVSIAGLAASLPLGLACLVFFVLYQQLENWLIAPKVMKRSVEVSDLAAILSALVGALLLGALGALIAIPVVASVQLVIRKVFLPRQQRA